MTRKIVVSVIMVCILILGMLIVSGMFSFNANAWGNKSWFDTTYTFNQAIIELGDGGYLKGEVEQWTDFEDGDMIQVVIDGKVYLTHSSNVVLISE